MKKKAPEKAAKARRRLSISRRIQISFLLVTIPVLLVSFAVFNIVVTSWLDSGAKSDMDRAINAAADVSSARLADNASDIPDFAADVRGAISALKLTQNFELVILTKNFTMVWPDTGAASFIGTDELTSVIVPKLREAVPYMVNRQIWKLAAGSDSYYISVNRISAHFGTGVEYLVLLRPNSFSANITKTLNIVFLLITFAAALIIILASLIVSRGLSKPIRQLRDYAATLGDRDFRPHSFEKYSPELRELAASMNEAAAKLESYDLEQKSFFQNASHELRTPLTSIRGYAEGLKTDVFKDPGRAVDIILKEIARLSQLVDELLVLTRLDSPQAHANISTFALADIVREVVDELSVPGVEGEKSLTFDADPGALATCIKADPEYIRRAVLNIASNCLRYAKTRVEITLDRDQRGQPMLTIADDGPGITRGEEDKIFRRFYKGPGGQYGLGLSIAKTAVERFGGSVTARGRIEGGAEFIMIFPETARRKTV